VVGSALGGVRPGIGTIANDGMVELVTTGRKRLGTIEESFVGKLKPGDRFVFAGRPLEFLGVRDMTARVRVRDRVTGTVPSWAGGRFPLSTHLAALVRRRFAEARRGEFADAEMRAVAPLLRTQAAWSHLPEEDELLIERTETREGAHWFAYPFLGRLVHEGLAAVLAYRLGRRTGSPVTATFTDYGLELLVPRSEISDRKSEMTEADWRGLLSPDDLTDDLLACLNAGELTKRQFREVARVAGLLVPSSPGTPRSVRQLQASSGLFYEVFAEFDPDNLLLQQARREVLQQQLEVDRLRGSLAALSRQRVVLTAPRRLTPMAFPIWAQRIQSQTLRVESAQDRIARMLDTLERAAGEPTTG